MPQLADRASCTGCTACISVCPQKCITMSKDDNGFLYPIIEEKNCVSCGLCESTCPIIHIRVTNHCPIAYAAYVNDTDTRLASSSGGIFTALSQYVLCQGGVVYGAAYDESFHIKHICIEDRSSLHKLQGAKYAQSDLNNVFLDVQNRLKNQQIVLFSGTPCQIGGLKAYLRTEYDNLITVDFICHGIPSPMVWEKYIDYLVQSFGHIRSINFRDKSTGWSNYRYSIRFLSENGAEHVVPSGDNLYMQLFVQDFINRTSCTNCHFKGFARQSDFTVGDFWGVWDILPEMDDDRGTSVILVHSEKAKVLWNLLEKSLVYKEISLADVSQQNPSVLVSSCANPNREAVLTSIRNGCFAACADYFPTQKPSHQNNLGQFFKNLLHRIFSKLR